jgi:hypothetical protein
VVISLFILHVSDLLFGENSLKMYLLAKERRAYLKNEIVKLQKENAKLQKDYFELKNLEPES